MLAVVALVFQLFPTVPRSLVDVLDFRHWSRSIWFLTNIGVLLVLLFVRFGPDFIDSWRQRSKMRVATSSTKQPLVRTKPQEDVRVLMRRDEQLRARLRRKFALYCLAVPALVLTVGAFLVWSRSQSDRTTRARNAFLSAKAGSEFHDMTDGVVGLLFHVRPDRDVQAVRLGVYDHMADGLNVAHRVGIFHVATDQPAKTSDLLVEATVPYGQDVPLEGGFRWIVLDNPVTLHAGQEYVLAAETFGEIGDGWPAAFAGPLLAADEHNPALNPSIVGDRSDNSGTLLLTDRPWPAVPSQNAVNEGSVPHGLANMIISGAD